MVKAKRKQRDDDLFMLAWQTAHLMNSTGNYKSRITPHALIGLPDPSREFTEEEAEEELNYLKQKFGEV